MRIEEVLKFLTDSGFTAQTQGTIKAILGDRKEGNLSPESEKEVRELLELELRLLDVQAQTFEDFVAAVNNFGKEVNEIANLDPKDLQENLNQREKNLQDFERSVGTRLDLLVSG